MFKAKIILRIEPMKGRWIVSVKRLPGLISPRAYIAADGMLTNRRRDVKEYDTAEEAYHALERLSKALEETYDGTPQEWEVSHCAASILAKSDNSNNKL